MTSSEEPEDVTVRSDKLDEKISSAGGPSVLVQQLTGGLRRQGRFIFLTACGLAADIVLSIVLFLVVLTTSHTTSRTESNAAAIANLVHTQELAAWASCEKSATNTAKIDAADNAFIAFLEALPPATTASGKASLTTFENIYRNAILEVPVCGPEPK